MAVKSPANERRGMRPREFADRYGLSEMSVYRGIRDGTIPAVRVGGRFVVLPEAFEAQVAPNKQPAAKTPPPAEPLTPVGEGRD